MWAISLTIVLLFPLLSAAPLELGGGAMDDNDGMHSHDENITRAGKFFGHNQFDVGNISVSGSVAGDDVSIGHQVKIDVQGHTHDHEDGVAGDDVQGHTHDPHHHEADTVIECKEGLREMFKSIDSNKDGLMDAKELLRVCHQNNIQITESLAVGILTLPDKKVGFNMAKFCELLKDCRSTNSAGFIYYLLQQVSCSGTESDWACCSLFSPCKENEGDCDTDDDCVGSLVCGKDNCINPLADHLADCCIQPEHYEISPPQPQPKEPTSVQEASDAAEMPNIGKLFQGYDVMKGNPLPVDPFPVDPGFRDPIFEPIYSGSLTADRRYLQPDGTHISICTACLDKFSSSQISGSKSYQENLARKVGLSVGGSIGEWGGKFSASHGYKEVAEKTSSYSNFFTLSSVSCCVYSANLLSYELPSLSKNFLSGVQTLTEKYDEDIYLDFIKAFGTHFIEKANMGSLYGEQSEISKLEWTDMLEKGIDIGIAAELSAYGVTASSDVSQTDDVKNAEIFSEKATKQKVFTMGAKPPADGKKGTWLQETIYDPAPIELSLGGSLLDLLEHDDLKAKVSTAVKTNLKKALDDYCGLLLKSGEAKTCSSPGPDPPFPSLTPGSCEVHVGISTSNTISVIVSEGCVCPTLVNKGNWLGDDTYPDEFKVTQFGSSLQVQRIDSNTGWSKDLSFKCFRGYRETFGINLDALTSYGKWGKVEKCSYPHFVNKMDLKYERRHLHDDTALNAIRLTCTDGHTISSSEGHWGSWKTSIPLSPADIVIPSISVIKIPNSATCPQGKYINAAQIRSEAVTWAWGDNTAANGIRFKCTDGSEEYKPKDGDWGSWMPWKFCEDGSAIYGIQTLVQAPIDGDDTALNNVKFFCAKLPNSG